MISLKLFGGVLLNLVWSYIIDISLILQYIDFSRNYREILNIMFSQALFMVTSHIYVLLLPWMVSLKVSGPDVETSCVF